MAEKKQNTTLTVAPRKAEGSRATRRLRRDGMVPGVLYGGEGEPLNFAVEARELRNALHASGAVIELTLDGEMSPAVLKDSQRHPVRGETMHVDFVRVNLNVAIQAVVPLELLGGDDSPGVREGGVLDQPVREVNVEALPTDIPEAITLDVSGLNIGDHAALSAATIPAEVTLLDDAETVAATVLAPRLQDEAADEIESETEVVGEGESSDSGDSGDSSGDDE